MATNVDEKFARLLGGAPAAAPGKRPPAPKAPAPQQQPQRQAAPESELEAKFKRMLEAEAAPQQPQQQAPVAPVVSDTGPPGGAGRRAMRQRAAQSDKSGPSAWDVLGDVAGAGNKALFDVIDLPSTLYNAGMGIAGQDDLKIGGTMDALRPYLTKRSPAVEEANDPLLEALRTGTEWGSPAAVVRKGASRMPDIAAGVGAAAGEYLGGETGELVGGLGGGIGGTLRELIPALRGGEDAAAIAVRKAVGGEGEQGEEYMDAIRAARARGEVGTVGDITQDPNLAAAEAKILKTDPIGRERLLRTLTDREQQQERLFGANLTPETSVNAPREAGQQVGFARDRVNAEAQGRESQAIEAEALEQARSRQAQQGAESQLAGARTQAEQAGAPFTGIGRPDVAAAEMQQSYKDLDEYIKKNDVKPAWKTFDEVRDISTQDMADTLSSFSKELPEVERAELSSQFKSIMSRMNNLEEISDPRDVQFLLSSIKDINRQARVNNDFGTLNKRLSQVGDIVNDALAKNEKVGPAFKDAIAQTVLQKQRLGSGGRFGKAQSAEDPETFVRTIGGFKGEAGAANIRRVMESKDPATIATAEKYIREDLKNTDLTPDTLSEYAAAFDKMPGLRGEVTAAIASNQTLREVEDASKAVISGEAKAQEKASTLLTKAIKDIRSQQGKQTSKLTGLPLSKFAKSPKTFISNVLSSKDDFGALGKLSQRFARKGPEHKQAFKNLVLGELRAKLLKATPDIDGNMPKDMQSQLNRLVDAGVVDTSDVKVVSDIIASEQGRRLRAAGGAAPGAEMDTAAQRAIEDGVSTALTLPMLSMLPSGHQLMAAGMLKRTFKTLIRQQRLDPKKLDLFTQAMADPKVFSDVMEGRIITKETPPEEMQAMLEQALIRLGVASGQLEDE